MLDHVSLRVSNYERSESFYDQTLAALGLRRLFTFGPTAGYGADRPVFWIGAGSEPAGYAHVAFTAVDRARVDAFYAAALGAGGRDNGPPGVRAHYHPTYYGAFVLDPDGHNIEAVCHLAP